MKGTRADVRLVELNLCQSRERARSLIMSGAVYLNDARIDKAGDPVPEDCVLTVREDPNPFVSRGGLKLEKAVTKYDISLDNAVAIDVGASTGGFTDCMLMHGAKKVYSIDVGYGQLDWKLRNDERVRVMERTNARFMQPDWFDEQIDFASMDVSFISISLILPSIYACLKDGGRAVVLVKPQFEAGKGKVGKNGVVRDEAVHKEVLLGAMLFAQSMGFKLEHVDYSPIKGPKGNIEFLLIVSRRCGEHERISDEEATNIVNNTVAEAHFDKLIT
ncbi:MAG: TlyA family RNA methyltransferase [Eubacteriales bacterium]|nr:TlyA family RNA methyltransferase [Eubacteriales bacterium]